MNAHDVARIGGGDLIAVQNGIGPVKVKDKNGNDNAIAAQAWIVKPSDMEKAQASPAAILGSSPRRIRRILA